VPDVVEALLAWESQVFESWPPGCAQVDAVTPHRHSLSSQQLELLVAERDRAIGSNDSVPRHLLSRRPEDVADKAWRRTVDVTVGTDESGRNRTNAGEDQLGSSGRGGPHRTTLADTAGVG
jgi:hypothetical protein